ncbi:MAG TPA: amino acid ABC transporter substrate-binding protein [Candidatus Alectryocaccomicrobium excrementavium]|uniref:Amino acid ABC transporter substrate-binding protein n=1 Tax=Candidatus Alectryocaccomicrobium excrementavium TaxID=2840668 RepID=A0A9D1G2C7_9FIRM|nr:amino acid ABC transporter substrate-binding protein [Candidatus Alectryocaccomicrobium excrementavium]
MKKLFALALVLMLIAPAALAEDAAEAADTSLDYILEKGTLILGLDASFPPMGFTNDDGEVTGFDIDLAREVCNRLGVELIAQPIDWAAKDMELSNKNIDCIWNGMSITDERIETMNMTPAYLNNEIVMVVKGDTFKTKADFEGAVIGVQGGSYAEEVLAADEALGGIVGETLVFDEYLTALMDLQAGNLDGVLIDLVVANYRLEGLQDDSLVVVRGLGDDMEDNIYMDLYGIGFRKGDDALSEAVWNTLLEMKEDGTLAEISTTWFGSDITVVE